MKNRNLGEQMLYESDEMEAFIPQAPSPPLAQSTQSQSQQPVNPHKPPARIRKIPDALADQVIDSAYITANKQRSNVSTTDVPLPSSSTSSSSTTTTTTTTKGKPNSKQTKGKTSNQTQDQTTGSPSSSLPIIGIPVSIPPLAASNNVVVENNADVGNEITLKSKSTKKTKQQQTPPPQQPHQSQPTQQPQQQLHQQHQQHQQHQPIYVSSPSANSPQPFTSSPTTMVSNAPTHPSANQTVKSPNSKQSVIDLSSDGENVVHSKKLEEQELNLSSYFHY